MKTIKNIKKVHNRSYYGPWHEYYDKNERKRRRKLFKAVRHKLLFEIPLTDEEIEFQKKNNIDVNSRMDYQGRRKNSDKTDRWRRLDGTIYYHHNKTKERIKKWKKLKKRKK